MRERLTSRSLPLEFALTLACCRWPPSPARDEAIRTAVHGPVDWPRLLQIARRHRVQGLVHHGLAGSATVLPPEISAALKADASAIAQANLGIAAESLRLRRLFDDAHLPLLFLKGISLAMLAYGNLSLKMGWDIDLLVAPDRLDDACAILRRAGYETVLPPPGLAQEQFHRWHEHSKESVWRSGQGFHVELHTRLADNAMMVPALGVASERQEVVIAPGASLPTLAEDQLFAYLCVHGASSGWFRLKWLADLAALLAPLGPAEVVRLYRRSQQLGASRTAALALLLWSRLLAGILPDSLRAELEAATVNRRLVRSAMKLMAGRAVDRELDTVAAGTLPIHAMQFFLRDGWRYKFGELRRQAIDPLDWARLPLPTAARAAYPIVRGARAMLNRIKWNA